MRAPFANRRVLALAVVSFFGLPIVNGLILFRAFGELAAGVVLGGLTGLVANFCAIPLLHVFVLLRDEWTITKAAAGRAPRDGRRSAVSGRIQPRGTVLAAPISGRACLAYHWEARSDTVNSKGVRIGESIAAEGLALAPSEIVGAHGRALLLDFNGLPAFPASETHATATGRVAEVLARPRSVRKDRELDGSLVEEHRARFTWNPTDSLKLLERVVLPGEQVAAVGIFSTEPEGLRGNPGSPLELRPGGFAAFSARSVRFRALQALALALGLVTIEGTVLWMATFVRSGE
jgi:hypothetical protein